jgi:poly(3-hydroxybutyrate) depolymerase
MTGFSMGGYLSNETGCLRPDFKAVAPHSGGAHDLSGCVTQHKPVLVMHFSGRAHPLSVWAAGARSLGCAQWLPGRATGRESGQGRQLRVLQGLSSRRPGGVLLVHHSGGAHEHAFPGHAWSGGVTTGTGAAYAMPETESATELSWDFFKIYAW